MGTVDGKIGRVVSGDELDNEYGRCILPSNNGRQPGRRRSKRRESQAQAQIVGGTQNAGKLDIRGAPTAIPVLILMQPMKAVLSRLPSMLTDHKTHVHCGKLRVKSLVLEKHAAAIVAQFLNNLMDHHPIAVVLEFAMSATMAVHRLAVIITNPSNADEFLVVKQIRPPKFGIEEYDSYVDSDLWDLPFVQLDSWQGESEIQVEGAELCADKLDLRKFDLGSALNQVSEQVGIDRLVEGRWRFWKYAEEADFGPGHPVHTVFITGQHACADRSLNVACQWMMRSECLKCLAEVKQDSNRVGPLVVTSILHEIGHSLKRSVPLNLPSQEYPPGIVLVPMSSRTSKPFRTTNLIVVAPETVAKSECDKGVVAHGDALIVDPGCSSRFHKEFKDVVTSLPRKLIVFVTHHHHDHVDGLSVIQKCNPDAILLAHERTMHRIGKGRKIQAFVINKELKS
ncbi:hypothetical protein Cgig2_018545 [Carnegiea gigantea]|uniref:Metallo-beta-lactamase domain-containing protein n=1 Tax=Carnegiea gigantea TaxID=171969 RepID=A0A9Q1QKZ3_9CARY|nr:hypothetical protein Cgig2_018545 [Carnegiea gigantea]